MDLSLVTDFIMPFSLWVNDYLNEIALSIVSTLLVIYGDKILAFLKKQIGSTQPILRITLFVIFCAFGFAFLTAFLTPLVVEFIQSFEIVWLPLIVVALFYLLGYLAKKRGFI